MKKIAIVNDIIDEVIFATYNKSGSEGHSKAFFKLKEDLTFRVQNSRKLDISSGDAIEIFIEPRSAIALSFFMFIMPLILFMTLYSFTSKIIPNGSEIIKISAGISGILISFFSTYLFFKVKPQKLPEITRIIGDFKENSSSGSCPTCGSCSSCS